MNSIYSYLLIYNDSFILVEVQLNFCETFIVI